MGKTQTIRGHRSSENTICFGYLTIYKRLPSLPGSWNFERMFTPHHVSRVTSHILFPPQQSGASWWRVCYINVAYPVLFGHTVVNWQLCFWIKFASPVVIETTCSYNNRSGKNKTYCYLCYICYMFDFQTLQSLYIGCPIYLANCHSYLTRWGRPRW